MPLKSSNQKQSCTKIQASCMFIWFPLVCVHSIFSLLISTTHIFTRTNASQDQYRPLPGENSTLGSKETTVPVWKASWKIHWKIKKSRKSAAKCCGKLKSIPNSTMPSQITHTMLFTSNYSGQDLRWLRLGEVKISYLDSILTRNTD